MFGSRLPTPKAFLPGNHLAMTRESCRETSLSSSPLFPTPQSHPQPFIRDLQGPVFPLFLYFLNTPKIFLKGRTNCFPPGNSLRPNATSYPSNSLPFLLVNCQYPDTFSIQETHATLGRDSKALPMLS